jgi:hypothetical protein
MYLRGLCCGEGKRFAINLKNNHGEFSAYNTLRYRVILNVSLQENNFFRGCLDPLSVAFSLLGFKYQLLR